MDESSAKETQGWTLTQVGVVVKDVEKVVRRLGELGIGPFTPMKLPPERQEWFRGNPMQAEFNIMGARVGGVQLELIQPVEGDSPHREFLGLKGEGIQHVMFQVDDVDHEITRLTAKGCTVLLEAHMPGGRRLAYIDLNAGGIIVELTQKRP